MEDSNPGREMSVSVLITRALGSLWDVARRRYSVRRDHHYVSKGAVEMAVYATTMQAMNLLKRATHELIKLKPDGSVRRHASTASSGIDIPREWSLAGGSRRRRTTVCRARETRQPAGATPTPRCPSSSRLVCCLTRVSHISLPRVDDLRARDVPPRCRFSLSCPFGHSVEVPDENWTRSVRSPPVFWGHEPTTTTISCCVASQDLRPFTVR